MNSIELMKAVTHYTKYARFLPDEQRRETWEETVLRNQLMHTRRYPALASDIERVYRDFVMPKKVLPSMRSLQFAGKPIELNESRIYNCSFVHASTVGVFAEVMFLLLSGTGVGYSVQQHHVDQLPRITKPHRPRKFLIQDDILGWSLAVKALIKAYLGGTFLPIFDYEDIRAQGELLATSGGRAPGAAGLKKSLEAIHHLLSRKEVGSSLAPLECHDMFCFIAGAVLSGGIRRAAMIALCSWDDAAMVGCKSNIAVTQWQLRQDQGKHVVGDVQLGARIHTLECSQEEWMRWSRDQSLPWWCLYPQRAYANNSIILPLDEVTWEQFDALWKTVERNRSGEPGFLWVRNKEWGTNPCAEIALQSHQFCNLVEINAHAIKNPWDLEHCAVAAAFLGTLQAGYTDFHFLSDAWRDHTEREGLLGISITGMAGSAYTTWDWSAAVVAAMQENRRVAALLGITQAARLTCIKPAGTTSLVMGTSSGCHAWYDRYYVRRMRLKKSEPLYAYLAEVIPEWLEDDYFSPSLDAFLCIPMAAPQGSVIEREECAADFLKRVYFLHQHWVKPGHRSGDHMHNVSATVKLRDHEWDWVGRWIWEHRFEVPGLSVLPIDNGTYVQAPHESIAQERYQVLCSYLSKFNLADVKEHWDMTQGTLALACGKDHCEV